jgi:hypothetical protein
MTGLRQPRFAKLLHVDVGTLRNGKQRRREPIGPVKALLRPIQTDPKAVLEALNKRGRDDPRGAARRIFEETSRRQALVAESQVFDAKGSAAIVGSSPSSGPRRCGDLTCGLAKRFLKIVGPVITGPLVTGSDPSILNCQPLFGPGRR